MHVVSVLQVFVKLQEISDDEAEGATAPRESSLESDLEKEMEKAPEAKPADPDLEEELEAEMDRLLQGKDPVQLTEEKEDPIPAEKKDPNLVETAKEKGPEEVFNEALEKTLEAERVSLEESLPAPEEDPRRAQLERKQQDKAAKELAKKEKEAEKAKKVAAKAQKDLEKAEKKKQKELDKQAKLEKKQQKKNGATADVAEKAPENKEDLKRKGADPAEVGEAAEDEAQEAAADAEEVEATEATQKKAKKAKKTEAEPSAPAASSSAAAPKSKGGRPRKASPDSAAATAGSEKKKARTTRRGRGDGVDAALVKEIHKFMLQWQGMAYDKSQHALHKDLPGLTAYWSRSAAGLKLVKADGGAKWQCCYFQLVLDKTCSIAVNLFLVRKFAEKVLKEPNGWVESDAAGVYYGLLFRSAHAAHDQLAVK